MRPGRCDDLRHGASPSRVGRADDLGSVEAERPKLVLYAGRFDGFHAVLASISKTCLVASTTTSTRWQPAPSGARSKSMPMRIAS